LQKNLSKLAHIATTGDLALQKVLEASKPLRDRNQRVVKRTQFLCNEKE
jgi:hypothetical protein